MTLNESYDLPLPSLRALIDRHGLRAVAVAFLRAALAGREHPPDLRPGQLSAHLLRDIGLDRGRCE